MAISYSVAIPARNATATIGRCLDALWAASPPPSRIIVFDDASRDDTAAVAEQHGADVIRHSGDPLGAPRGRNRAIAELTDDYVLSIDADVVIEPDAPSRLVNEIARDDAIAAAFGSYGTEQFATNIAGRYANLRHHYFHQRGAGEAETFWTGLGAIRRAVFVEVGGFSDFIEDVELGFELNRRGYRVRLVANAQGTHLKNWTLRRLWRDDVVLRALPWSRLIVEHKGRASLNAEPREAAIAGLAHLVWISALLGFFYPAAFAFSAIAIVGYIAAIRHLLALLQRHDGWRTAIAGAWLHWVYHLYASTAYGAVFARYVWESATGRKRTPTDRLDAEPVLGIPDGETTTAPTALPQGSTTR
ncbi:MAG: glycosyltransferase family 2 protein [Hyphomicrobiales bacterium]|nr:glycosyltransferase family 2 protein [Hyphomicrobiales bacterium]